jgi:hypothetical protein
MHLYCRLGKLDDKVRFVLNVRINIVNYTRAGLLIMVATVDMSIWVVLRKRN